MIIIVRDMIIIYKLEYSFGLRGSLLKSISSLLVQVQKHIKLDT